MHWYIKRLEKLYQGGKKLRGAGSVQKFLICLCEFLRDVYFYNRDSVIGSLQEEGAIEPGGFPRFVKELRWKSVVDYPIGARWN